MNNLTMNHWVRLACAILVTAFLFLSTGPDAHAQAPNDMYSVKIYPGVDKEVCVGQTTTLTVHYRLNKGKEEAAPPIFSFQVTNGSVPSENPMVGAAGNGWVYFDFNATKAGDAALYAQANQGDGYDMKTIPVVDCQYKYNLTVKQRVSSSYGGVILKYTDILIFEGTFTPSAVGTPPLVPLTPNGNVQANLVIQDQEMSDSGCNAPATKWTGLKGSGTVNVTGQFVPPPHAGVTIDFVTVKVDHNASYIMPCKDKPIDQTLILSFMANSWIHEQFPAWGGAREIKIDTLEQGVNALNESEGTKASYDAILIVKRVK